MPCKQISILFMLSYNSITDLLFLGTWKIHNNNTYVGVEEVHLKVPIHFYLHTLLEKQKAEGKRMRTTENLFAAESALVFLKA